ncbi:MAG: protein-glutamate O-methyltransferase CheR [Rhodospirillales bacterium]|nr:protein-glutamate O-methyltransferase CheR [Rhodospirillales bacterium]
MTTNETLFSATPNRLKCCVTWCFRSSPGEGEGQKLRIWSAACSTGQEACSVAITVRELGPKLADWPVEIIGTDISPAVLVKAKAGVYSQFEVQRGMPIKLLIKYFDKVGTQWKAKREISSMIQFREQNMLQNILGLGSFDIVFCRNLLIYFDRETKQQVLERIGRSLAPDGTLFLGGTETVIGLSTAFEPVPGQRGIYRRTGKDAAPATARVA